jgi:hypothetical protein
MLSERTTKRTMVRVAVVVEECSVYEKDRREKDPILRSGQPLNRTALTTSKMQQSVPAHARSHGWHCYDHVPSVPSGGDSGHARRAARAAHEQLTSPQAQRSQGRFSPRSVPDRAPRSHLAGRARARTTVPRRRRPTMRPTLAILTLASRQLSARRIPRAARRARTSHSQLVRAASGVISDVTVFSVHNAYNAQFAQCTYVLHNTRAT